MNWVGLLTIFFLSTIKFMFAPLSALPFKLTFWETYFACVAGGIFGAAIFYFSAGYFMERAVQKRAKLRKEALESGIEIPRKKVFTKTNKIVVKIKHTLGIYGTAMWVPFFLSIPIGSIITAKFYRHDKRTFPIIILGMFVNGLATTGIVYLIF